MRLMSYGGGMRQGGRSVNELKSNADVPMCPCSTERPGAKVLANSGRGKRHHRPRRKWLP